jgi:hypothetical protein
MILLLHIHQVQNWSAIFVICNLVLIDPQAEEWFCNLCDVSYYPTKQKVKRANKFETPGALIQTFMEILQGIKDLSYQWLVPNPNPNLRISKKRRQKKEVSHFDDYTYGWNA